MIHVRDLRVDYDDVCAVRNLTLDIPQGEIFGLIGPNGAGKTTTLRALIGLQVPTYGDILLNGIDLGTHREEAIRTVGFMPDFSPIYTDLTVGEFLDMFAASYGIPREQRADTVDRYLALVDLAEKRDAMTAGLSRGMQQRLMLAKTLLPEPKIILLDEPASGLDPHGRALLKAILREQGAKGCTVLISSHILSELSEFCTSVGIMERGSMVVSGRVEEVAGRVSGQSMVTVEVFAGADACATVLSTDHRVGSLRQEGNLFTFAFTGSQEELAELPAALVTAGVQMIAFGRKKDDLEELFMRVGAKEVA